MLLLTFVVVSSPLHMDYELIEARARFDEEYPDKTSLSWPVVKECEANFTIIRGIITCHYMDKFSIAL
ncbi:hypothetical protein P8452_07008 [Trifolium repens]|nr:hypothetical protein P8452_07008 [Trifolium repens]